MNDRTNNTVKKYLLCIIFAIYNVGWVFAQNTITVTFKPSAAIGCDAIIFTTYGSIIGSEIQPRENINYGEHIGFGVSTWTMGGDNVASRALLKFTELSTIPSNAKVISAELKLYGVSDSDPNYGNNQSIIQRITSVWDEQTITWNSQPTTTLTNQITVPKSTSEYNWNFIDSSANLVAMVQNMISNPENNFGFMFRLVTEETYRRLSFASSDYYSNPALYPELTVTYEACSTEIVVKNNFKVVKVKNASGKKGDCHGC
jgi:hypothetical protein